MIERTRANDSLSPSARSGIGAFVAMDLMRHASARQAAGEDIIHMEVGSLERRRRAWYARRP